MGQPGRSGSETGGRGPWWAVVPVKPGDAAKSRLTEHPAGERIALARAFARDTLAAVAGCPRIAGIVVVGADPREEGELPGDARILRVDDDGRGLNPALDLGRAAAPPEAPVVAIVADLPALRSDDVDALLAAAAERPRSIVCDAAGIGTTALAVRPGTPLDPRFGPRSRAAHVASGAVDLVDLPAPGLRRDVDSEVDLHDALRLGVGPATRAVLSGAASGSASGPATGSESGASTVTLAVTCRTWSPGTNAGNVVTDDGVVLAIAPDAHLAGLLRIRAGQRLSATVVCEPGPGPGRGLLGPVIALELPAP